MEEEIKDNKGGWCVCNLKKTCMGCLIEMLVRDCYGGKGVEYLKNHVNCFIMKNSKIGE